MENNVSKEIIELLQERCWLAPASEQDGTPRFYAFKIGDGIEINENTAVFLSDIGLNLWGLLHYTGNTPQGEALFQTNWKLCFEECEEYFATLKGNECDILDPNKYCFCERCGSVMQINATEEVHVGGTSEQWCENCIDRHAFYCEDCHEYYDSHSYDHWDTPDGEVCDGCFEEYWCECADCGERIRHSDAFYDEFDENWYCPDCYDNQSGDTVRKYHKDPPIFYNTVAGEETDKYIGCEIETEQGFYDNRRAITARYGEGEKYIYQMHDGSLDSSGIECITQPMSKRFFDQFNFKGWFEELVAAGARSHNTNHCGLHIHLSKTWFGSTTDKQELTAGTVIAIMGRLKPELQAAARRTDTRWCHFPDEVEYGYSKKMHLANASGEKQHSKYCKSLKKVGKCMEGRYECLNLLNRDTYEFRIFKGTLNAKTFRASVALCLRLVEYAKYKNRNHSRDYSWMQFKSFKRMPKVLADYLVTRNL